MVLLKIKFKTPTQMNPALVLPKEMPKEKTLKVPTVTALEAINLIQEWKGLPKISEGVPVEEKEVKVIELGSLKPKDRLPKFAEYIRDNSVKDEYNRTYQQVADDLTLSYKQARDVTSLAIEKGLLSPKRSGVTFKVNQKKLREVLYNE